MYPHANSCDRGHNFRTKECPICNPTVVGSKQLTYDLNKFLGSSFGDIVAFGKPCCAFKGVEDPFGC